MTQRPVLRCGYQMLKRTTADRAVQLSTAKPSVLSNSVLCMGRISENPVSASKEEIDWFTNSSQCRELDRIDGEPMEFQGKVFTGFTTLQILAEIQNMMSDNHCELEHSKEEFSSCQCITTLYGDRKE